MIDGGSGWTEEARQNIHRFLDAVHMPVTTSFRRRDIINHDHPCYVGELGIGSNPALLDHMREADLVIMVNDQLSDVNTIGAGYMEGFTLFEIPFPKQTLIHVAPDLVDLNRVFQADLAIQSDCTPFAKALIENEKIEQTGK